MGLGEPLFFDGGGDFGVFFLGEGEVFSHGSLEVGELFYDGGGEVCLGEEGGALYFLGVGDLEVFVEDLGVEDEARDFVED